MIEEAPDLVHRARAGDKKAFELLVVRSLGGILRLAAKMMRHEAESWDIAQEACIRAWTKIGEFRGDSAFSTWIYGITAHVALDRLRARPSNVDLDPETELLPSDRPGPESIAETHSLGEALSSAIDRLPEGEQTVFILHEQQGMRYREIASALQIPIGTVMSRLHKSRLRLQEMLSFWWKDGVK